MVADGLGGAGVRRRVTAVAAVAVLVVLAAVATAFVVVQRTALLDALEAQLLTRAASLAEAAREDPGVPAAGRGGDDVVWQVLDAEGRVTASSDLLAGVGAVAAPPPSAPPDTAAGPQPLVTLGEGRVTQLLEGPVRVLRWVVESPEGPRTVVVLGALEEVQENAAALRTAGLVAVPLATLVLAAVVWVLVGRALAPVEAIRAEVADITGSDLDRRVPVPSTDDEVARLAATMNSMLDRLEASVTAQRRFVSDASHELRSPLTRLRTQLETARPGDSVEALRQSLLEDTGELQDLVEDLLVLARIDEGRSPTPTRVDLDELVLAEVARVRSVLDRGVEVDAGAVSGAEVLGDRGGLQRVVRNLLDNAVRHAASRVEVSLVERGGEVELVVADDGPGIPEDQVERVFDRFTRLDEARAHDTGGSGLGLAIVREVTERHGGHVELEGGPRPRFVVVLPATPASSQ